MAETEQLLNINLQTSSSACTSCLASGTNGQDLGSSGNFSAQLDSSLKELSVDSGEVLPSDGKILPDTELYQVISPIEVKNISTNLQVFLNGSQTDEIGINTTNIPLAETILSQENGNTQVDESILGLHQDIEGLSEIIQQTSSNVLGEQDQDIQLAIQDISKITSQVDEQLVVQAIPTSSTQVIADQITQVDKNIPLTGTTEGSRVLAGNAQPVGNDLLATNNLDNPADKLVAQSASQKLDITESITKDISEDFKKSIVNNISNEINYNPGQKNQILSAEIFQQSINTSKPDASLQSLNASNAVDVYNNINSGSLSNRPIEAPVPLLIKQGVPSAQIQQSVDQSIEQNVKWLIGNAAQNAKINVFPESLGQVNIALNLEDSNLKLNFIASSSVTKDLIEASITTLRNQFSESGINLQEVNIETSFSNQSSKDSNFENLSDNDSNQFNNDSYSESNTNTGDIDVASLEHVNKSTSHYLFDAYV